MGFDARKKVAAAEKQFPPFEWTDLDGETRHLRHAQLVPATAMQTVLGLFGVEIDEDNANEVYEEVLAVVRGFAVDEASADAASALPSYTLGELIQAWVEDAGDMGKSASPSSPRNRAERRSGSTPGGSGKPAKKKAAGKKSAASRSAK